MIKIFLGVLLISQTLAFYSMAQVKADLIGALLDSQEDIKSSNINPKFDIKSKVTVKESMTASRTCSSDTQNSLPLRLVLSLLRGKGAGLKPTYNPTTGLLNIYGGPMIGNCSSMLDPTISEPNGEIPYAFEMKIKGCGKEKCPYSVQTIENDKVKTMSEDGTAQTMDFAPTMDGFLTCLEKTGVIVDGKINKEKIVVTEFDFEKNGLDKTGDLVFASRGPATLNMGGAIYSKKNLYKNDDCYYYEDVKEDGFKLYSLATIEQNNLLKKAEKLCSEANYAEIYNNLDNFKNIAGTYQNLEAVMKADLLKQVAKAKIEFDKAVKKGDLSKVDTEKYAELMESFYKMIVQKHFDEDSHNSADEANPELLVNLYSAYEDAESKEEKDNIEKKIRDLTKKLSSYMEEPYFTPEDYKYFVSMKRKAPLKDPKWKSATLSLQKSLVSLRASCQAYSVDNSSCRFDDSIEDMMDISELNEKIDSYAVAASKSYSKKESVLKSPGKNNSDFYASKVRECKELYSSSNQKQMAWQQMQGQYQQQAMQYCQQKNQYVGMLGSMGGYYTKKYQQCIEDKVLEAKAQFTVNPTSIKLCDSMIDKYEDQYEEWANLESQRDEYYESSEDDSDRAPTSTAKSNRSDSGYNFNYTPTEPTTGFQNQTTQQYMNPQMYQQQQMQMQGQYQNTGYPIMNGMNYGMNSNTGYGMNNMYGMNNSRGLNYGLNYGLNLGMGNNSGYQQRIPYSMNNGYGMNTMPSAMTNYMGNSSMTGGNYNFTYAR